MRIKAYPGAGLKNEVLDALSGTVVYSVSMFRERNTFPNRCEGAGDSDRSLAAGDY